MGEGGSQKEIDRYGVLESMCVQGSEIERHNRRDGGGYRYGWRVERGNNISCTRWIDLSGDGDL